VSYLFYGRIIDKIVPKSPLQVAIAGLTRGTDSFITALGDYSKTAEAKKTISENMSRIAEKKEKTLSPFSTPLLAPKSKQEVSEPTPYFSRRHYLLQRTAGKEQDTVHRVHSPIPIGSLIEESPSPRSVSSSPTKIQS